jgi:hypothetical protein
MLIGDAIRWWGYSAGSPHRASGLLVLSTNQVGDFYLPRPGVKTALALEGMPGECICPLWVKFALE